jgi:hypothetical protein
MKIYTDSFKENNVERAERVNAMLKSMIIETALFCYIHDKPIPKFTREQISEYCGCSKRLHWSNPRFSFAKDKICYGRVIIMAEQENELYEHESTAGY